MRDFFTGLAVAEDKVAEPQHLIPVGRIEADGLVLLQIGTGVEVLGVGHMMLDELDLHVEALGHGHHTLSGMDNCLLGSGFDALHKSGIAGFLAHENIGGVVGVFGRRVGKQLIHGLVGIVQSGGGVAVVGSPGGRGRQGHNAISFLYRIPELVPVR